MPQQKPKKQSKDKGKHKKIETSLTSGRSIFKILSEEDPISTVKYWFKTGLPGMDNFISGGRGLPGGKLIEIYGDFSTGKTALGHYLMQMIHRLGGWAVFIDFESTLDSEHLRCYPDIDFNRILYSAPDTIEEAWEGIYDFLNVAKDYSPFIICLDSVAAAVPAAEADDKLSVAPLARVMSRNLRKLITRLAGKNGFAYFTNQIRSNIGTMAFDKTTRPGGRALDFYADIIIRSSMKENLTKTLEKKQYTIGYLIELTTKKNRKATPRSKYEFVLSFDTGIDVPETIVRHLLKLETAVRRGAKIRIGDDEYKNKSALISAIEEDVDSFMSLF